MLIRTGLRGTFITRKACLPRLSGRITGEGALFFIFYLCVVSPICIQADKPVNHHKTLIFKSSSMEFHQPVMLLSKKIMATVMFIDIRNFTRYARTRGPEEIAHYQNAFFKIVIDVVMRYNGVVHQFLGDGCMVTFGTPIEVDNPSRNAVFAAVALLKELELAHEGGRLAQTRVGIGIHTGEIVKGAIGPSDRQQDFISGTVVILASRIEQMNKPFGTQIL